MNLKASILDKYSINVVDVDSEKKLADYRLENSFISEGEYEKRIQELNNLLPFFENPAPIVGENDSLLPYYEVAENSIIQKWEVVENDTNIISLKIKDLKYQLSNTDYKVMKCYEATLLNLPLPYNIGEVHQNRQCVRDEINMLEELIASKM